MTQDLKMYRQMAEATVATIEGRPLHKDAANAAARTQATRLLEVLELNESSLAAYLERQRKWSSRTFGTTPRTGGMLCHIRKELMEIERAPYDLEEWIDVIILAMDGYWRHGGDPAELMAHLQAKQQKNFERSWPAPVSDDVAVEHVREMEP